MTLDQIIIIILIIITLAGTTSYIKKGNYDAAFESAYQIILFIYIIILLK